MDETTALEAAHSWCNDLDLPAKFRGEIVVAESGTGAGIDQRDEVANGQVIQRQAGAVPIDAAE
jgi:hypothetical protein